jgi:hypothetical protein
MREGKKDGAEGGDGKEKPAGAGEGTNSFSMASTEATPDKTGVTATTNITNPNTMADDISPEGLLEVISQEWKNELERIKAKGLNGYKRRKESWNECLVQSGHAEIEGDTMLFIYGNALEVLSNSEF